MRQRMQETLYRTGVAGDTLWESECRSDSMRQPMQVTLFQTGDAGETLWDSGFRRHSIGQ